MPIKESIEAEIIVEGNPSDILNNISDILSLGILFTNININNGLYQITADYKESSIQGEILISLFPENEAKTKIIVKSTSAKSIFVLANSNEIILEDFKNILKINNTVISTTNIISNIENKTFNNTQNLIFLKKLFVFLFLGVVLIIGVIMAYKLNLTPVSNIISKPIE